MIFGFNQYDWLITRLRGHLGKGERSRVSWKKEREGRDKGGEYLILCRDRPAKWCLNIYFLVVWQLKECVGMVLLVFLFVSGMSSPLPIMVPGHFLARAKSEESIVFQHWAQTGLQRLWRHITDKRRQQTWLCVGEQLTHPCEQIIIVKPLTALALSSSLIARATIKPVRQKRFIERARKVKQNSTDSTDTTNAVFALVLANCFPARSGIFLLSTQCT